MAFKQKGFPMHSTKSALKQKVSTKTSSGEKIDVTYPDRGFSTSEMDLVVENPERTKLQKKIQEIYDISKLEWDILTEAQQNELIKEMKEAQGKEFQEGQKTYKAAREAGTYEEYLLGVGGGEGRLSKEEWMELNKENIIGQFGTGDISTYVPKQR